MSSNSTNDSYPPSYSSFSGKVLLKAVIVIMIITFLYVLLHLCSRYFFGRHIVTADHIRNMNSVHRSNRPPQRSGLHPSVISSLPVFPYDNTITKQDVDDGVVECTVCLGQLEDGQKVKMLPRCKHVFHIDCIDMWLYSHSSCPVCRANAEPPDESDRSIASTSMIMRESDTSNMKDVGSTSSFRNSFRRILIMDGSGGRRTQESGEMVEDLERQ